MTSRRIGAAIAGAALVASIAGAGVTAEAAPTSERAAAAPIAVSIDSKRMITMPTTVQPGVNEFVVTSAKPSGFQIVSLHEGYTIEEAEADLKGFDAQKVSALRRFEKHATLIGGNSTQPEKSSSMWVDLEPGDYIALDVRGKTNAAKWVSFTATGLDTGASMPAGDKVKAVRDASWANKPKSIARKGVLTLANRSSSNHFIVMVKMTRGATLKQVKKFMMTEEGKPPIDFETGIDSGFVSPGHDLAFEYKLPAGNYALMCFWPDASMGGMPHAAMGMIRQIKLT